MSDSKSSIPQALRASAAWGAGLIVISQAVGFLGSHRNEDTSADNRMSGSMERQGPCLTKLNDCIE